MYLLNSISLNFDMVNCLPVGISSGYLCEKNYLVKFYFGNNNTFVLEKRNYTFSQVQQNCCKHFVTIDTSAL